MFKNQKPEEKNNITEEKISWYRRRWFWGMVLAPILIFGLLFFFGIMLGIRRMSPDNVFQPSVFLTFLTYGFILFIFRGIAYPFYVKTLFTPLSYLLTTIYCLILIFLFYKTFRERKVKIRYPIILLIIFILSIYGFTFLFIVS